MALVQRRKLVRCKKCGYTMSIEEEATGFVCPVCGSSEFEIVQEVETEM